MKIDNLEIVTYGPYQITPKLTRRIAMCKCNLCPEGFPSQVMAARDEIIIAQFTIGKIKAVGFSPVNQPGVVACILPGTDIDFQTPAIRRGWFNWLRQRLKTFHIGQFATFRRVCTRWGGERTPTLSFPGGTDVPLEDLRLGLRARIRQVPSAPSDTHKEKTKT